MSTCTDWSFAGFNQWPFNYRTGLPKQSCQDDERRSNKVHLPRLPPPGFQFLSLWVLQQKKQQWRTFAPCVIFTVADSPICFTTGSHRENDFFLSLSPFVFAVDWQKKNVIAVLSISPCTWLLCSLLLVFLFVYLFEYSNTVFVLAKQNFHFNKLYSILQVMYLVTTKT